MKRHLGLSILSALVLFTATPVYASNCGQRDLVVEKLSDKYDEHLAAGGLQNGRTAQTIMEIWASTETGTFTVLITNPQGVSCIVAAGTDFFKTTQAPKAKESAS